MTSSLKGWHPGEAAIQSQLEYDLAVKDAFELFSNTLPSDQRTAHSRLIFLPLVTLDHRRRPWISLLTSPTGGRGFVSSPAENITTVEATPWDGDPLFENIQYQVAQKSPKILIAGTAEHLDLVVPRNKFSGFIREVHKSLSSWSITLEVIHTISIPNRYLSIRSFDPYPHASPVVEYLNKQLQPTDRLPEEVIQFILRADSAFFGTSYVAAKKDEKRFPSHLTLNHRGGNPGFLRVRPSDGRTIVFPDYSGNHNMNSLGNIEATPVASFTIPCFTSGDVLYLTGTAKNFVWKRSQALMPRVNVLTTVRITGFIYIRNALPFRERKGSFVPSPFCPPVRFLTEERPGQKLYKDISVTISQVHIKTQDIAVFTFETSREVLIKPGEWAMLDFSSVVGPPVYPQPQKVTETFESSRDLNDDRIRSWTVSSCHSEPTTAFEITMRRKPNGVVTTPLFEFVHKLAEDKPADTVIPVDDARFGPIRLVSIGGDFVLPEAGKKLLWIAGGIGITPFISLLQAAQDRDTPYDITLLISTRQPDIHLTLFRSLVSKRSSQTIDCHQITVHIYSETTHSVQLYPAIQVHHHKTRLNRGALKCAVSDLKDRTVWICAPSKFSDEIMQALIETGVEQGNVTRESFMW